MKENFTIAVPKIRNFIIPPLAKNIKYPNELIKIKVEKYLSTVSMLIPSSFGVLEKDLIYIYLLQILKENKNNTFFSKDNNFSFNYINEKDLFKRSTITIKIQDILKLLNKSSGGSNYEQIYKSNMKLSQSIITWELCKSKDKIFKGASNMVEFNINGKNMVTVRINEFYVYHLLQPYRNYFNRPSENNLLKYTLINLEERLSLKNELNRYIHEWLSYDIFPNNSVYKIYVHKIVDHIRSIRKIDQQITDRWERNTRYAINQSIIQICHELEHWELINSTGRGKKKVHYIRRHLKKILRTI